MKKVTIVLGLGVSGVAAAELLLKRGKLVLGIDSDSSAVLKCARLKALGLFVQGESEEIEWNRVERVVVSPGVSPKHPIYKGAKENQISIIGEAELALSQFIPNSKLLAVTGTNGKTTVTLLVEHILKSVGIKAKALGNVGDSLCKYLIEPAGDEVFIVELSSYQLETMSTPVFDAAVLLNITPDHLDRYADLNDYAQAKCSLQHLLKKDAPFYVQEKAMIQFGSLMQSEGIEIFSHCEEMESILPLEYIERKGHDCENALAAWALCQRFSVTKEQFCSALKVFKKPPHRVEFVREIDGVSFYDDSKGTNIDAVVKAVQAMVGPVILIAGGVDKGASYLLWKEQFFGKVKEIVAIGQAAPKIYSELHPYFNIKLAETLDSAVQIAASDAESGDAVLLSPGCSSFDMFRDYAHRGEEFQHCVHTFEGRRKP